MNGAILAALLLLLALAGLANAVYFALLYYRVLPPDSRRVPAFCRMEESACASVVFAGCGRLFGVPNSLPGIGFYLLLLSVAAVRLITGYWALLDWALALSLVTVIVGAYLVYALMFRLRTPCPL
jgi:uncharacterized membrane protein